MLSDKARSGSRDRFLAQLERWKVLTPGCDREYIQRDKLIKWMTNGEPSNVDALLAECQPNEDSLSPSASAADKIASGQNRCLLVFGILLELDVGGLVYNLRKHEFWDCKLPLDVAKVEKTLRALGVLRENSDLAQRFNNEQWKYCPLSFELDQARENISANQIAPFYEMQLIKEGGTSFVYEVMVQEEFVNQPLRDAVPNSLRDDPEHGPCFIFALKTFKDGNKTLYQSETTAFRKLKENKGLIKCLFHYSRLEDVGEGRVTYNLLLEFGKLDLSDYFAVHGSPVLDDERLSFWWDLFRVVDTVRDIHEFKHVTVHSSETYYGWHADIKPDNILNVQGGFKLADPGFARFEEQPETKAENDATIYWGGTSTFGAPECYLCEHRPAPGRSMTVSRSIDIWSLGCVLSVAATWVVYGSPGLEQFDELRREAIRGIVRNNSLSNTSTAKLEHGYYFHDGRDVPCVVREWHKFLRRGIRRSDTTTSEVLDLVDRHILIGRPDARISAQDLSEKLQKIKSGTEQPAPVNNSIREVLVRMDEA